MYEMSDIRDGLKVDIDGAPYEVIYFQFVKPGKGTPFTRTTLKPLLTGTTLQVNYRDGDKLMPADWTEASMTYADDDGATWRFVDPGRETEALVPLALIEPVRPFLFSGGQATVCHYNGEVVRLILPELIDVVVARADRSEDPSRTSKPATLTNGTVVEVPGYIHEGNTIRVSTVTGSYVDRISL